MQAIAMPSPHGDCEPSGDYVQTKCQAECEAKYVISNCSCKELYMPGSICEQANTCVLTLWKYAVGLSVDCF